MIKIITNKMFVLFLFNRLTLPLLVCNIVFEDLSNQVFFNNFCQFWKKKKLLLKIKNDFRRDYYSVLKGLMTGVQLFEIISMNKKKIQKKSLVQNTSEFINICYQTKIANLTLNGERKHDDSIKCYLFAYKKKSCGLFEWSVSN